MVRSSLGRSVLLDSGGLAEEYPFCAISVPDFLKMTEWQPHQDLKASGKVKEMGDKAEVLFCSHQWCSFTHPDPNGDQLRALQTQIRNLMKGKTKTKSNFMLDAVYSYPMLTTGKEWKQRLPNMYIWLDYLSIPQPGAGARLRDRQVVEPDVHVRQALFPLLAGGEHRVRVHGVEHEVRLGLRLALHQVPDLRLQRPQLVAVRVGVREAAPLVRAEEDLRLVAHLFYLPARLQILVGLPLRHFQEIWDRDGTEGVLLREAAAVEEDGSAEGRAHHCRLHCRLQRVERSQLCTAMSNEHRGQP